MADGLNDQRNCSTSNLERNCNRYSLMHFPAVTKKLKKIYLRQGAAQRWISYRDQVLQGERPHTGHTDQLNACDAQLRAELVCITDEAIYSDLRSSDYGMGRWTQEDPSLRHVQRWVRARR
ncbi:hypothetical protein DID88_005530 [Monilinia fructigena]|uniref:Uncharacterized protein n=1 Tax=Monilinia fructigena TaxID=38457 RepID=A0A395J026_9HELO|nr:hypothetical protein DID88_005530 [Monilinia fructigena]